MTQVLCPKDSCIYQHRDGYCIREKIELEMDACEPGLMDCNNFITD